MRDAARRLAGAIQFGLLVGTAMVPRTAVAADPVALTVLDDNDVPIVAVEVSETLDPKGLRYDVYTTLGADTAARVLHLTLTRQGSAWTTAFPGGFKGGPFKKLISTVKKAGAAVSKRYKGLAKLAPDDVARAALIAEGKAAQAAMTADAAAVVATVNATPSFELKDLAAAQIGLVLRYYDWFYAHADGLALYGPKDKKAVTGHVATALELIHPAVNVGACQPPTPKPHTYTMNSKDCPPDDFVPFSTVDLSQECYGKKGLYQDQDFKCSAIAPQGTQLVTDNGTVAVSFRECCLEHDRAFFCGGVTTTGVPTGAGPGTYRAWQTANAALVRCVSHALLDGYEAVSGTPDSFILGSWESFFSNTGFPLIWFDSTLVGDAWQNGWNDPAILDRRLDTCLCGGDQPVPLCENHCFVNDCSLSLPDRLDKAAFENYCDSTCVWTCVEEREDGEVTKRYKRKRVFDQNGNVLDSGFDFGFTNCTATYEMPCDCEPYERQKPAPPPPGQCQIPAGFFDSLQLPTAQAVLQIDP